MKLEELAKLAIKHDSEKSPDERVVIGHRVYTKREVYERIEAGDKEVIKFVLKPLARLLGEDLALREQTLKRLGLK